MTLTLPRTAPATPVAGEMLSRTLQIETRAHGERAKDDEGREVFYALAYEAGALDTYGTTMTPDAFRNTTLDSFRILQFHNPQLDPVGKPVSLETTTKGLRVGFVFADTPRAQEVKSLVEGGFLRAVSVGFIPLKWEVEETQQGVIVTFTECELHELSLVNTPSSKGALVEYAASLPGDTPPAALTEIIRALAAAPDEEPAEAPVETRCESCGCHAERTTPEPTETDAAGLSHTEPEVSGDTNPEAVETAGKALGDTDEQAAERAATVRREQEETLRLLALLEAL